jgi:serine/threonine protein kinase
MRLGPYEVLGLIGAGGMGEVYRARDTRLQRIVALKLIRRDRVLLGDSRERYSGKRASSQP